MSEGMEEGGYTVSPEIVAEHVVPLPPGYTFTPQRTSALSATRRLLDEDANAATMVASLVNTQQSAHESRPAFVKRIVRAWLDEMGRAGA